MSMSRAALGQLIHIASAIGNLGRRVRRSHPSRITEIEELSHVDLGGVPLRQRRHIKTSFNELQNRSQISHRVRDVVLPCIRRDNDQRHAVTGIDEVTSRPRRGIANITWKQIQWHNAIWTDGRLRRNVIVEASEFVEGENKG